MNGITLASQWSNSDTEQTTLSSQTNSSQADFQQREKAIFSKLNQLKGSTNITPAQFNELKQLITDYHTTYPQGGSSRLDNTTIIRGIRNGSITADNIKEKLGGQKFGI